jgi:dTDP-4-amino-4,6-dideoxygalactose transaminase
VPLHQQKAYAHMGHKAGDFPVTEKIAPEIVSLPMFPQLTPEQQARIVAETERFLLQTMAAKQNNPVTVQV